MYDIIVQGTQTLVQGQLYMLLFFTATVCVTCVTLCQHPSFCLGLFFVFYQRKGASFKSPAAFCAICQASCAIIMMVHLATVLHVRCRATCHCNETWVTESRVHLLQQARQRVSGGCALGFGSESFQLESPLLQKKKARQTKIN